MNAGLCLVSSLEKVTAELADLVAETLLEDSVSGLTTSNEGIYIVSYKFWKYMYVHKHTHTILTHQTYMHCYSYVFYISFLALGF